jgi:diguanylate cyclase (GGDEF)-like protein
MAEPDLFEAENAALAAARATYDQPQVSLEDCRTRLGELLIHYERLMRATQRMIRRSDRAERDLHRMNRQLQDLTAQLEYRASHDPLTGALSRDALVAQAVACLSQSDSALIVLDIDHFKRVNDDFGHPVGDAVIRSVVQCLRGVLGPEGAVGRVGGEEFSVVLAAASAADAAFVGRCICEAIADHPFDAPVDRAITASVGVSWNRRGASFERAYARADQALYEAKRSGRNCVRLAESG